jgi:predicted transposase YbfD/YdcC
LSKKTVDAIIDSGNDYLIQVKGNQPTLFQAIIATVEGQEALSTSIHQERSRGRGERRTVAAFPPPPHMVQEWTGLHRVIHVERQVTRGGKETVTHHYYISSVSSDDAEVFARGVRGHWSIENRLHWVKDVIQHEDDSGINKGNGIETLSIFKNVAINISRELGFDSIKGAAIHFASNVKELLDYFRT